MSNQQNPLSRRARRTNTSEKQQTSGLKHKEQSSSTNTWKWLRYVLLPLLLLSLLIVGMMVGYAIFGEKEVNKGKKAEEYRERPAAEVLNPATWKHMWDLIFKTE